MSIEGIIFDLDGVIVTTDEFHYQGWWTIADREGIYFDRGINERLRGVSRMESLAILLERAKRSYSKAEKLELAEAKNNTYRKLLGNLGPDDIFPGVMDFINRSRNLGLKLAIGSSSKNTPFILEKIGLTDFFDAVADGNDIKNSKPDPAVFLLGASRLGLKPADCLVIEDAEAGVTAALAGGMKCLAVGAASKDTRAHFQSADLRGFKIEQLFKES